MQDQELGAARDHLEEVRGEAAREAIRACLEGREYLPPAALASARKAHFDARHSAKKRAAARIAKEECFPPAVVAIEAFEDLRERAREVVEQMDAELAELGEWCYLSLSLCQPP